MNIFNRSFRFLLVIIGFIIICASAEAQILKPVKWSFASKSLPNGEAELVLSAKIDNGWYLYSQDIPKGGPIPTSFKFAPSKDYKLVGKTSEPKPEVKEDPNFEMKLKVFHSFAAFSQKIKVLSAKDFTVKGTLEFMCCDNKQCLPPDEVDFEFEVKGTPQSTVHNPQSTAVGQETVANSDDENESNGLTAINNVQPEVNRPQTTVIRGQSTVDSGQSLWAFFIIALIAGLAGTVTPCVFPMIPMTVSFFVNQQKNRRKSILTAVVYGLSIILIYTAIGLIVSLFKSDADTLNMISTHWITNIAFFSLFIVFAASFFGMFEITLPSKLVNKTDRQADKGGMIGAFFMALTLVLVSFSCTGPIIGAILIEAAGGAMLKPIIGMFGFGLAFALPFIVLALFPSLLGNLPKSGGWLHSVKIVMAFIILALSLKFFVMADQTYHWDILSRFGFISIWIILFTLLGLYLIGIIKFEGDNKEVHLSFFRLMLAVATFVFVLYLIPGLFGANLKLISGFLPPPDKSTIITSQSAIENPQSAITNPSSLCDKPLHADIFTIPYNIPGYFDYKQALACAKKLNKPLFVAFTGHACGNCHKMENDVWSDHEVLKRLMNDYIVVMLYVDDRTELAKAEWVTSTYDGKVKNTIGKLNADIRISRFKANTQPFYVLLDTDEKLLNTPKAYDLNIANFVKFLDEGISKFKAMEKV